MLVSRLPLPRRARLGAVALCVLAGCSQATEPAALTVVVRLPAGDTVDTRRLEVFGTVRLVASIRNVGSDTVWLARECRHPSRDRAWVGVVGERDWLRSELSPAACSLVWMPLDTGLALAPGVERTDSLDVSALLLAWSLDGRGRRIRLRYAVSRRAFRDHTDAGDPVPVADRTSPPLILVREPAP
ncbi:MAG: hypothetical protein MUE41_18255 [Gemmatimonadaceae bacterium]|jgi:hypothetical protein|nr:hypothetical protein [Gemmatimonadaceae bacterium]